MNSFRNDVAHDEHQLGVLAMHFRATRVDGERRQIADEYGRVVLRLIGGGQWDQMPGFEDQLPDNWMPAEFFDYWR